VASARVPDGKEAVDTGIGLIADDARDLYGPSLYITDCRFPSSRPGFNSLHQLSGEAQVRSAPTLPAPANHTPGLAFSSGGAHSAPARFVVDHDTANTCGRSWVRRTRRTHRSDDQTHPSPRWLPRLLWLPVARASSARATTFGHRWCRWRVPLPRFATIGHSVTSRRGVAGLGRGLFSLQLAPASWSEAPPERITVPSAMVRALRHDDQIHILGHVFVLGIVRNTSTSDCSQEP
jgi:hypothetical protein